MGQGFQVKVTRKQKDELEQLVRRPSEAAGRVRRARVILLSAEGVSGREVARRLDLSPEQVSRIRTRFRNEGVPGLHDPSKKALRDHLDAFMRDWHRNPTPFEWTKPAKAIIESRKRMLDRISTAMH